MKVINVIEILSSCTRLKVYSYNINSQGIKEAHHKFSELIQEHESHNDEDIMYNISGVIKNAIVDGYYENNGYKLMIKNSE